MVCRRVWTSELATSEWIWWRWKGRPSKLVDDGSVLFSSYTIETGYTLALTLKRRVSVYKHCASLLKRQGDFAAGGEAIALMGNTGDSTTGPHLHRVVVRGRPTDPSPWLGSVNCRLAV